MPPSPWPEEDWAVRHLSNEDRVAFGFHQNKLDIASFSVDAKLKMLSNVSSVGQETKADPKTFAPSLNDGYTERLPTALKLEQTDVNNTEPIPHADLESIGCQHSYK